MIEAKGTCPYIINMDEIRVGDLVKYRPDVLEDIGFDPKMGIVVAERICADIHGVNKSYYVIMWSDGTRGYIEKRFCAYDVYPIERGASESD